MYGNRRYYEWPMVGVKKGYIKKLIVSDNFAWQQATDHHLICRQLPVQSMPITTNFHIVKMYKDKWSKTKMSEIFFLSMCDVKKLLTFTSLSLVLL